MNNKGVSLITVTVIIIVMIIIATTSILAGNKLIVSSKEYVDRQLVENVIEAVKRRKSESKMEGSITPIGVGYPGKANPVIGNGQVEAIGWYQADEDDLKKLGVTETNERMLINYDYEEVLPMRDPKYLEKYEVSTILHKIKNDYDNNNIVKYLGEELHNYSTPTGNGKMYVNSKTGEAFGDGWYYLSYTSISLSEYESALTSASNDMSDYSKCLNEYSEIVIKPYTDSGKEPPIVVVNYETGRYEISSDLELHEE